MSPSQQALVDSLAGDIAKALGTSLLASPGTLDAISQFTKSNRPKLESLGKDFAMQVISNWRADNKGTAHPLTREEVTKSVIEWFSSEASRQISNDLVDYTITSVTRQRLASSRVEETVDGNVVFDAPLVTHTVAKFAIAFGGLPAMDLEIAIDVDAELTVNDAVTKLQSEPVLRVEEIDLRDCEASVEVSGPLGIKIGDFKVPIKGDITL
ncbi:MAG: hypothetical protein OK474_04190 [Thaumarchaeota archaeon]|nr:hypothetical protein [Nitrososphaerota archaeon]